MEPLPSRFRLKHLFDCSKGAKYPEQSPEFMKEIQDYSDYIKSGMNDPPPWTEQQLTAIVLFFLSCNAQMIDMVPKLMRTDHLRWPHVEIDTDNVTYKQLKDDDEIFDRKGISEYARFAYLDRLMTVDDCAEKLGVHVRTVEDWVARYALPFTRFAGQIYIDVAGIFEEMMKRNAIGALPISPSSTLTEQGGAQTTGASQ